jgi:hypothetical protein
VEKLREFLQKTAFVFALRVARRMGVGHSQKVQDMRLWLSL